MSIIRTEITIEGIGEAREFLGKVKDSIKDLRDVLEPIAGYLLPFYKDAVFETEGQVIGESWAELSYPYRSRKAGKYPGRGILQASGSMRNSMQIQTSDEFIRLFIPDAIEYAKYHQEGTSKMPQRVILKLDDERFNVVREMMASGISKKIKKLA